MVNSMSRTHRTKYFFHNVTKNFYSKHSVANSRKSLKYRTRRNNRVRTKTIIREIKINPNIADTAVFNAYHKQEDLWKWF